MSKKKKKERIARGGALLCKPILLLGFRIPPNFDDAVVVVVVVDDDDDDGFSETWFNQSSRLVPFVEVACQSYLSQFYTVFTRICQTFTSLCHQQTS